MNENGGGSLDVCFAVYVIEAMQAWPCFSPGQATYCRTPTVLPTNFLL